ncbi:WPP domain-interacting tail-anchored protein 1-like [Tripterygium wilfordii]|uniref:WPP domain-interacting tail-anchored protein 1-like n=1 Tax=Tripterygium wilfordii TaxID=458696 RepID=UPI0018F8358F|nr:WPP domain-interacting tail-anchored protein 1-like [Tripterygium wilfordii]XP_038699393.1 WPP domain-interacting tail-anchored protein 1-like [Tripterygium wilfordii]
MDMNGMHGSSVSDDVNAGDSELESNKVDLLVEVSSNGETIGVLGIANEILMRTELDLACSSEKLVNLNVLMMHVATRETDFEAFVSDKEYALDDSAHKAALEFDLLSGILDSEVEELDTLMATLQIEVANVREMISSSKHSVDAFLEAEEKLRDSEETLKQSQNQILDIRMQSSKFQRILSCQVGEENWNGDKGGASPEDGRFFNLDKNLNSAEQRRHVLRMLEKSLAREIDLEQKLSESRQIEEELKVRLLSSKQEAFFIQEEATDVYERLFEVENAAEVLMGISKDLLGQLQIAQFNLNGSAHRESLSISKLEDSKQKSYEAERRVNTTEEKCKSLEETSKELNEELKVLRDASEKVNSLEKQLRESDFRLQHAVASAEASQEKENMLHYAIKDMENLIEDLKLKISRAESRADSAEDKCIILSETNADLNEELSFLRSRLECLEASLNHAEETKMATAKDIGLRTKVITNLLIQLAIEREKLHKQISSLVMENQILVMKLQQTKKVSSVVSSHDDRGYSKESHFTKPNVTAGPGARETKEEENEFSATASENKTEKNVSSGETEVAPTDSVFELGRVRRIDAGVLNFKHFLIAILFLLISSAVYLLQLEKCPF